MIPAGKRFSTFRTTEKETFNRINIFLVLREHVKKKIILQIDTLLAKFSQIIFAYSFLSEHSKNFFFIF